MGKIINFIKDLISPPRMSEERFDTGHYIVIREKEIEPVTWVVNGLKYTANTKEEREKFNKNRKFKQGVTREGFPIVMSDYIYYLKKHVEIIHKGRLTKEELAFNAKIDKKLATESAEQQL